MDYPGLAGADATLVFRHRLGPQRRLQLRLVGLFRCDLDVRLDRVGWALVPNWGMGFASTGLDPFARTVVRQLLFSDPGREASRADTLFRKAQREYLNGNWIGAEQLIVKLIDANPNDIDAQLLLASVLRRTGQLTEAAGQLRQLEANDEAENGVTKSTVNEKLLDELFIPQILIQ